MSRQKKCLYQKIIALVCLFAVCLTGFAAYFAIKNTGSVQAAEYTFTDSSGNQVGDGGRIAMRRSRILLLCLEYSPMMSVHGRV